MRGVVMHSPGDVRVEERERPQIVEPTDAIIRVPASCICGSDLWPYRGIGETNGPTPMGHEYVGTVEEVGDAVSTIKPGQFVIGSFFASDNTCEICQAGYQTHCVQRQPAATTGAQSEFVRIALADGTLVATPGQPEPELIPSLLAASDVLGTGWFAAVAAQAGPGKTVAVVGDGAVGLLAVLAAKQLGAERIIAMSRHDPRQKLAREFGATDIVEERGDEGVARVKELTGGFGAHSVVEAVGTQESLMQAIRSTPSRRPPRLRRGLPRRGTSRRGFVLLGHQPARRPRPGPPVPARVHRPDLEPADRPRQGVRPGAPAGPGSGRLRGDGHPAGHQGPPPLLTQPQGTVPTSKHEPRGRRAGDYTSPWTVD